MIFFRTRSVNREKRFEWTADIYIYERCLVKNSTYDTSLFKLFGKANYGITMNSFVHTTEEEK